MAIYLDYNSTTPIDLRVLDYMVDIYKNVPGNPDSRTHIYGEKAREKVEIARNQVAHLLGITSDEVFFTSGATESNNIAIRGLYDYAKKTEKNHIITTTIEHKSILETVKYLEREGFEVDYINPDSTGRINSDEVISKIRENTLIVSIMHVNNETGIIQPVHEIGEYLQDKDVYFHVDATQSCGKLVDELRNIKYDMLSFSAHKLRGPQGVGVLVLKKKSYKRLPVKNVMYGGQQENGIRPGTVPVALVAGCGLACEIAENEFTEINEINKSIKKTILDLLKSYDIDYVINGNEEYNVNNTLNICFKDVSSEALMLCTKDFISISNGSACTSKSYAPSYVLKSMNIPTDDIESSVRISWGADIKVDDLMESLKKALEILCQIKG